MSFYNKKEEVLDIQLTQYGKVALARGIFRPHSYKFFDDDIIYDISYISSGEHQNAAQPRILSTVRKKPAMSIYGSETKINELNSLGQQKDGMQQLSPNDVDNEMLLRDEIKTYSFSKQNLPQFSVSSRTPGSKFVLGSLTKTTSSYMNSSTDKVRMSIDVHTGPNNTNVQIDNTMLAFRELLEFCKKEEYEIKFYEIEKVPHKQDSGKLVEKLKHLYFNSTNKEHALLSDRFVYSIDAEIENQEALLEEKEDCVDKLSFTPRPSRPSQSVMRDLYQDLENQVPDCGD